MSPLAEHKRYPAAAESFFFAQFLVASLVIILLTAADVDSYAVYILVMYVVTAVMSKVLLSATAVSGWQRRIWRVIQAAGVVVAIVLLGEVARVVRESGVIG